jgi:hypothetical protein
MLLAVAFDRVAGLRRMRRFFLMRGMGMVVVFEMLGLLRRIAAVLGHDDSRGSKKIGGDRDDRRRADKGALSNA